MSHNQIQNRNANFSGSVLGFMRKAFPQIWSRSSILARPDLPNPAPASQPFKTNGKLIRLIKK
jgi:hypothetical protein